MKLKIDYFLIAIIRQNGVYIAAAVVLIAAMIGSFFFYLRLQDENNLKIVRLTAEIVDLKKKAELVGFKEKLKSEGIDIEETNKIFNQLVPEVEDYFSVMLALEKLSQQTNFLITGYSINLKQTNAKKLSLTVSGQGDSDSFLTFLRRYNYAGGRLVTIDNIDFSTSSAGGSKLTLNFYSGKQPAIKQTGALTMTQKDKDLIRTISEKTTFEYAVLESPKLDYATKQNPF